MLRVLMLCVVACCCGDLLAQPVIEFDPRLGGMELVEKDEIGGPFNSHVVIRAIGSEEVARNHGNLTGVLFQATAQPVSAQTSAPVKLSYAMRGQHNAALHVSIGKDQGVCEAPAWIWVIAAKFAKHRATGAVTLVDDPQTPAEKRFHRRWRTRHGADQRLVWARYHPVLDDTLMGFFLLTADALAGDAQHARTLPLGLINFEKHAGYPVALDPRRSRQAASDLDEIIRLRSQPGDCAMLNDVDSAVAFHVAGGKLQITGDIHYHFARRNAAGAYRETQLTAICRENASLVTQANPLVHQVATEFARLVAFFRYVDQTAPEQMDAFLATLKAVEEQLPSMKTPIAAPLYVR